MNVDDLNRRVSRGLSRKLMEGAVSFRAPKVLLKEYGPSFSKMTLGFECEIAMEKTVITPEKLEKLRAGWAIDYEMTMQIDSFTYSLTQYLRTTTSRNNIGYIISRYNIKPRYGFAGPKYKNVFLDFFGKHTDFFNFKVVDYDDNGKLYAPAYGATGTQDKNSFVFGKPRVDFDKLFDLADDFTASFAKFIDDNELKDEAFLETLSELVANVSEVRTMTNDTVDGPYSSIFKLWRGIDEFRVMFGTMTENMLSDSNASNMWSILNENGNIKTADVMRSLSIARLRGKAFLENDSLILYDSEKLEEDYNTAIIEAKAKHFSDYVARRERDFINESSGVSRDSAVDFIHGLVLDNVDDDAKMSYSYHDERTQKYKGTNTVVEPDGSIEPNGAEVVSPVFKNHKDAFTWLDNIFDMIDANGLSTNKTTGLHVNIGTFARIDYRYEMSKDNKDYKGRSYIDVVKLGILSGDVYLLEQFKRNGNEYAIPLVEDLGKLMADFENYGFKNQHIQDSEVFKTVIMQLNDTFLMRKGDVAKYRTINTTPLKNGYLEFRIAGGENYHKDKEKIKRAVFRYMQLCAAASDPKLYAKEYLRALYKIFVGSKEVPVTTLPKNPEQAIKFLEKWVKDLSVKTNDKSIYNDSQWNRASFNLLYGDFDKDNLVNLFLEFGRETWGQANAFVYASIRLLLKKVMNMDSAQLKTFYNENKEQEQHVWHSLTYMPHNVITYIYTGTGLNLKGKP